MTQNLYGRSANNLATYLTGALLNNFPFFVSNPFSLINDVKNYGNI